MQKVTFRLYHTHTYGKDKGKPNPATFVTLTLYRDASKGETVKDTIKRLEEMLTESSARWQILTAKETENERSERYKREGIEVVKDAHDEDAKRPIINSGVINTKPKKSHSEARVAA